MRSFDLERPGGTLRVSDLGGEGAPIVMAHGVGSSADFVMDAFGQPLRDAGWRLVTFDLRGHGASSPARRPAEHGLEVHAADLWRVASQVGAQAVGGVSLGGHAAVAAVLEDPSLAATVLACIPAWTGRSVPGEGPHAVVARNVRENGPEAMISAFEEDSTLPGWLRRVLVRDWRGADVVSLRLALESLDGGLAPTEADLRRLPVPLAVVGWPDDPGHPLAVAADWAGWAPSSALETLLITDLEEDLTAFGRVAATALERVGADPSVPLGEDRLGSP